MAELEETVEEQWKTLRQSCEQNIAHLEALFAESSPEGEAWCAQLRRLLPLIQELETRPSLHWLAVLQHHFVIELAWPESSPRAWERVAYFYEEEPGVFYVECSEVVFLGPLREAVDFVEALAARLTIS